MNKCDTCGKVNETVEWVCDPFQEEIHGVEDWSFMCSDCYQQSAWDI
jgi:hypothetical protein